MLRYGVIKLLPLTDPPRQARPALPRFGGLFRRYFWGFLPLGLNLPHFFRKWLFSNKESSLGGETTLHPRPCPHGHACRPDRSESHLISQRAYLAPEQVAPPAETMSSSMAAMRNSMKTGPARRPQLDISIRRLEMFVEVELLGQSVDQQYISRL